MFVQNTSSIASSLPIDDLPFGSNWTFPSDHIPIGGKVNSIHFASWNILNHLWVPYLDKGAFSGSNLFRDNPLLPCKSLSKREEKTIDMIFAMFQQACSKTQVMCLQEVSKRVLDGLLGKLQAFPDIGLLHSKTAYNDMGVILWDRNCLDFRGLKIEHSLYTDDRDSFALLANFEIINPKKGEAEEILWVNTHIPVPVQGYPTRGLEEFTKYLREIYTSKAPIIICGDFNHDPELVEQVFKERLSGIEFSLLPMGYFTTVFPDLSRHQIDHAIILNPSKLSASSGIASPGELSSEFESAAQRNKMIK